MLAASTAGAADLPPVPVPLEPLANLRQRVAAQDLPYSLHWNDPELPGDTTLRYTLKIGRGEFSVTVIAEGATRVSYCDISAEPYNGTPMRQIDCDQVVGGLAKLFTIALGPLDRPDGPLGLRERDGQVAWTLVDAHQVILRFSQWSDDPPDEQLARHGFDHTNCDTRADYPN